MLMVVSTAACAAAEVTETVPEEAHLHDGPYFAALAAEGGETAEPPADPAPPANPPVQEPAATTAPAEPAVPEPTTPPTEAPAPAEPTAAPTEQVKPEPAGTPAAGQPSTESAPPTTPPPYANGDGHVHQWETYQTVEGGFNCEVGSTWIAYDRCTLCGITRQSAFRPDGKGTPVPGGHKWVTTSETTGVCPQNKILVQECSVCHESRTSYTYGNSGGHSWGEWTVTGAGCQQVQTRTCVHCHATETKNAGGGHVWVHKEQPATCTETGEEWYECYVCGTKRDEKKIPLRPHYYGPDDGDCTTPQKCVYCGHEGEVRQHKWAAVWSHDNLTHWKACTNPGCTARHEEGKHNGATSNDCTRLSSCTVCGIKGGASGMQHDFSGKGGYVISSTKGHQILCANPGCKKVSSEVAHDSPKAGSVSCTAGQDCVCGYTIVKARNNHNYGAWSSTPSGHSRVCKDCGYVDSASHTGKSSGNGGCTSSITCTTCGYVISPGYPSHSYGVWMANGSSHYRTCTHPGCTATQSSAHTGGSANCQSGPVCAVCGFGYGGKSSANHVGGTEVRNYKAADVNQAGYTGDTYCLGCDKKIATGTRIAMLAEDHTHSYTGGWKSDSSTHWKLCACGEHGEEAAHSFSNGKCTACGAADPNYKVCSGSGHAGGTELRNAKAAEVGKAGYTGDLYCTACGKKIVTGTAIPALDKDHKHEYSVAWRSDSSSHWKDCVCGEIDRKAAHTYVNGICGVCGAVDPNAEVETHVHTYSDLHCNGQYHWRVCTVCGFQAEKAAHVMLNNQCLECGYEMVTVDAVKDVGSNKWFYEPVKQVLEAGILTGGKTAGETTEFKPQEKVALSDVADAIYRLAGSPMAAADNRFTDIDADDFYAPAVSWVTDNNIVDIYGDEFDGDKPVTLQEMATFLFRLAQQAGWDTSADSGVEIVNAQEIDEMAADAMAWAVTVGLTDGIDANVEVPLTPAAVVTRAEAAAILANFMGLIETNGLENIDAGVETVQA